MLVMGFDPGSYRCGYGAVRAARTGLQYLAAGVIDLNRRAALVTRLIELGADLAHVCKEMEALRGPNESVMIGVEAGYADGHGGSALVLGAARGVTMYVVASAFYCPIREYAPSTVKKATTGYGKADKAQVARMVALRLGLRRALAPDAGDALAIAITRAQDGTRKDQP